MAVTVQPRRRRRVALSDERVRVRLELVAAVVSRSATPSGEVGISGARVPRVDGRPQPRATQRHPRRRHPGARPRDARTTSRRRSGARCACARESPSATGSSSALVLELGSDWPGVALALELRNAGAAPARCRRARAVRLGAGRGRAARAARRAARAPLPRARPPVVVARALARARRAPAGRRAASCAPACMLEPVRAAAARRGLFVSESATALGAARARRARARLHESRALVLRGSSSRTRPGTMHGCRRAARPRASHSRRAPRSRASACGSASAAPVEQALAQWAERAGREMAAPVPARVAQRLVLVVPLRHRRVTPTTCAATCARCASCARPLDVVQIDDGFQSRDRRLARRRRAGFPDGLAPLAREIRAEGFRAGALARAVPRAAPRARLRARSRSGCCATRAAGRSPRSGTRPGRASAATRSTRHIPGVEAWLEALGREVRALGFDYLKLDFLFAGALAGKRHDPRRELGRRPTGAASPRCAAARARACSCSAAARRSARRSACSRRMRIGPDVDGALDQPDCSTALVRRRGRARARGTRSPTCSRARRCTSGSGSTTPTACCCAPPARRSGERCRARSSEPSRARLAAAIALSGGLASSRTSSPSSRPSGMAWLRRMLPSLVARARRGPRARRRSRRARHPLRRRQRALAARQPRRGGRADRARPAPRSASRARPASGTCSPSASSSAPAAADARSLGSPRLARCCGSLRPIPADGARARWSARACTSPRARSRPSRSRSKRPGSARVRLRLAGRREGEIALALPRCPGSCARTWRSTTRSSAHPASGGCESGRDFRLIGLVSESSIAPVSGSCARCGCPLGYAAAREGDAWYCCGPCAGSDRCQCGCKPEFTRRADRRRLRAHPAHVLGAPPGRPEDDPGRPSTSARAFPFSDKPRGK